jgi:serine protease AprX
MLHSRHPGDCPRCGQASGTVDAAPWPRPEWTEPGLSGKCRACTQRALYEWLLQRAAAGGRLGFLPFDDGRLIPLGVFPAPRLLGHDLTLTGRGVTIAFIDSGFYPHPDLAGRSRLLAWADTSTRRVRRRFFASGEPPRWPGWSKRSVPQWHGMMIAAVAAGSGRSSRGWFCGFAPEASLVYVQAWDENGRITNASITRALRWLLLHRERLRLRIVNLSVGGDPVPRPSGNRVDAAVRRLVEAGVVVVAASGNKGRRGLLPPATADEAITVGGLDTQNSPEAAAWRLWHGNWGKSTTGARKPDLIAPSLWVPAPVMPGSAVADEARRLFARRADDPESEMRIVEQKFISPAHQHVEGTSFAAAIVSGVVACMLEANPGLTPAAVRELLRQTARPLPGVPAARQGAGVIQPRPALELAGRQALT